MIFTQFKYKFPLQIPITACSKRSDNSTETIIIATCNLKSKHLKPKYKSKHLKLKHVEVYWI